MHYDFCGAWWGVRATVDVCSHKSCLRDEKIWLPVDAAHKGDVVLHEWCVHCGLVKNLSDDRPRKLGFWMNVLSFVAFHFGLKKVQVRLIAKKLTENYVFSDLYGVTGSGQKAEFIRIVRAVGRVGDLERFLAGC